MLHLQRADGVAMVGASLGEFLVASGALIPARQVLDEAIRAASKIGDAGLVERINIALDSLSEEKEEE